MNLIEIYIAQVIKYLPPGEREDVKKELYSNILSMLPDDYTAEDIEKALDELGDPVHLADEYRNKKRYLIGPKYYHSYIKVLKLLIPIIAGISILGFFLDYIFTNQTLSVVELITGSIISIFQAAVGVFAAITIVFAVVEYHAIAEPVKKRKWTVQDLKSPIYTAKPIPKSEGIAAIVFSVLFFMILYYSPELIGWYAKENGVLVNTPLFNLQVLNHYMPMIVLVILFGVLTAVLKIVFGYWNVRLAVVNLLSNVFSAIIWSVILSNQQFFNEAIFEKAAQAMSISLSRLMQFWTIGIKVLIALIIVGCIIDSISGFTKSIHRHLT
jgi:hypothetical protein